MRGDRRSWNVALLGALVVPVLTGGCWAPWPSGPSLPQLRIDSRTRRAPSRILVLERPAHHYLRARSYTITVTGLSTACDGVSAPQTGRRTVAWQVPA